MRVLLISVNTEEIYMRTWPLGLACVAESARVAGYTVEFLDLMQADDPDASVQRTIKEVNPDVIGLSVRNIDSQKMTDQGFFLDTVKEIAVCCRSVTKAPVVLGGAGYSIYPDSLLEYLKADMGIQGEGETAFVELISRLERGTELVGAPGLCLPGLGLTGPRHFEKDLDNLPLPNVSSFADSVSKGDDFWLPVQTRRGCPMNCSYCSTGSIEGRLLRKRSPQKVVEWLYEWRKIGVSQFYFVDNTFNLPPSYAGTLCSKMISKGLNASWRCIMYPARVSEGLVRLMAESGCKEVSIGFESGSTLILNSMNKKFTNDDVRYTCDLLAKYGIRRMGFLLLGGPGETKETTLESLRFADSLNLEVLKLTVGIRIYPQTILAETAVKDGIVSPDDNLLEPQFYLVPNLQDWIRGVVDEWMSSRPNWVS
ncbi:MAG: B12-binding domain-containing radical SAM protein [Desulfomonilaceae bacterium]